MSIALVQSKAGGSGSGATTATSTAVGYTSATTAGNLLILVACADGDSSVSISTPVTSGFTWTSATTEPWSDTTGTSYGRTTIFYIANASAMSTLTTTTVGATGGTTFTDVGFTLYEFSGVATTSAVDVTAIQNNNTATLTTPTTANLSTTATDLIFVAMAAENTAGTAGAGYTLGVASPSLVGVAQYILNQASGSISTAFGGTSNYWACAAVSFKSSGGVKFGGGMPVCLM